MSTKRKAPVKLAAPIVKANAKKPTKSVIDENRTSVSVTDALQSSQVETIEISSDEDSDEDFSDAENQEQEQEVDNDDGQEEAEAPSSVPLANGSLKKSKGEGEDAESDDETAAPSFGELLRGNETIDVSAMLQQSAPARTERTAVMPRNHQSLITVLSQALKTDDSDLLETCLHTSDLTTVRNTIERIDSSLAGKLLMRLAARLHRRPGRAGSLMVWVQWTLIAHGGALASQPKLLQNLNSLQKVLAERAKGLNSLLALKGKLDILDGQMELRRKMQRTSGRANPDEEEGDEDVIYVEGEENEVDSRALANGTASSRRKRGLHSADDDDDEDEHEAVLTNGFVGDSEDEEEVSDEDEDDDSNGEEEEEPLDEDEVNYDDVDESMGEDEESDMEAAPPSKVQKVASSFNKKK